MIIFILAVYIAILVALIKLKLVPNNLFWKLSPLLLWILLTIGFIIPMGWAAPTGMALVGRQSVAITPNVPGEVIEVAAQPNTPLKAGEVLFRIDPAPYESQLQALKAQLQLAETRLRQMTELARKNATPDFNVEERQSEVDRLRAQIDGAKWNLDKTTVRAPADGYVTNLALRKGARVTNASPVMAFIDTLETVILVKVPQIYARYIEPGQKVEIAFDYWPGEVFAGVVEAVLPAVATGQVAPSGEAFTSADIKQEPFVVRVKLNDPAIAEKLPGGSFGTAAIYTDHMKVTHVIRQVILRQKAILNYIIP